MTHHHAATTTLEGVPRIALIGSPNAGKTTLFNSLTGLRAKTGNYPGVTVAKYEGITHTSAGPVAIEDLPGAYSLDPISPDEQIVAAVLEEADELAGMLLVVDATNLRRGLGLIAQVQQAAVPLTVVLTFADELHRRGGRVDPEALSRALGVQVLSVVAGQRRGVEALRDLLTDPRTWPAAPIAPPTEPEAMTGWTASILDAARYQAPQPDSRTGRLDRVLLHPVLGSIIFFATMFAFFQIIFEVAAPAQSWIEEFFVWLGDAARSTIPIDWLANFVADALLGGVAGVLVFLPQIALLFVLISLLEGSGYLSRAAYLMDRVMASAGLEGRAFVALLSSLACAIPGIMATRTLPSAKDRLATMMAAPLMTCSARLPVYVLLIGMLVPQELRIGPLGAQGMVMFGLYLLGAISAMASAWLWGKIAGRSGGALPFYMEMPPYRLPRLKTVAISVWDACAAFLKKVTSIILLTTVVLWALLNVPLRGEAELIAAGVDVADEAAVTAYVLDHSVAAHIGRAVEPVFAPLGFDWRVNVGVLSSLAAREVFVATLGQVASAADPEDPAESLSTWQHDDGSDVFTPETIAALLVFFVYAMQCVSTLGVMRRETGTWRWPVIAFVSLGITAWVMALAAKLIVGAIT